MPWHRERRGGRYCVIQDDNGRNMGCHDSKAEADRQIRALYKNAAAEMTVSELNRQVEAAMAVVLDAHEDRLAAIYTQAIQRIGDEAASYYERELSLTAAAPIQFTTPTLTDEERERAEEEHRGAAERFALLVLASLGIGIVAAEAIFYRAAIAEEAIVQNALDELRRIVNESFELGLSVDHTAGRIRERFAELSLTQGKLLARTQLSAIVNEGALRAAKEVAKNKPVYKTWRTVGDNRVRPAHAAASGQTVPLEQAFQVGGFAMMHPGDFSAPGDLVYNCRCSMSFSETLVASASGLTLGGAMSGSNALANVGGWHLQPDGTVKFVSAADLTATQTPLTMWTDLETLQSITVTVNDEEQEDATVESLGWRGAITFENVETSDGRYFHEWQHRELPLPLNAQIEVAEGHMGAQVAGRIDRIWKMPAREIEGLEELPEDAVAVMGEGELTTPFGVNVIGPMVEDQTLRGVSVDFSVEETVLRDLDTGELIDFEELTVEQQLEMMFGGGNFRPEARLATIAMATIVGFPAFAGANLSLIASGGRSVVATAHGWQLVERQSPEALIASAAPLEPPAAWFSDPGLTEPTPLTVTPEGRVYGHLAEWGKCHRGVRDACVIAPHSRTGYAHFHTGTLPTDEGDLRVGRVTVGIPHAPITATKRAAESHYDNANAVVAFVRCGEDQFGPWLAGAIKSNATPEQVRDLRANPPSGDWRDEDYNLELIAVLGVPVAGFPIAALNASGDEVMALQMAWGQEGQIALVEADEDELGPRERRLAIRTLSDEALGTELEEPYWLRTFTQEERDRMAKNGQAMPDGSFPIANCQDAKNARRAIGRTSPGKRPAVQRHIAKREKALNCPAPE